MRKLTARDFVEILNELAGTIEANQGMLSELDGAIGDGDHGVSMTIGWRAVREKLKEVESGSDAGLPFRLTGLTFVSSVGAAMGPLYGSGFIALGNTLTGKSEIDVVELVPALEAFLDAVTKRGRAKVGDKTMVDTIVPLVTKLRCCVDQGESFAKAVKFAVEAGEQGMMSTTNLIAKIGRASRLGERTLGHQDAGATSAYLMLKGLLERTLQKVEETE